MSITIPELVIIEVSMAGSLRIEGFPVLAAKSLTSGHTASVGYCGRALNRDRSVSTFMRLTIISLPPSDVRR